MSAYLLDLLIDPLSHHCNPVLDDICKIAIIDVPIVDIFDPHWSLSFCINNGGIPLCESSLTIGKGYFLFVYMSVY